MKFLPLSLAAIVIGADALLTNPVKDIKRVQVYVVIAIVGLVEVLKFLRLCNAHWKNSFY